MESGVPNEEITIYRDTDRFDFKGSGRVHGRDPRGVDSAKLSMRGVVAGGLVSDAHGPGGRGPGGGDSTTTSADPMMP